MAACPPIGAICRFCCIWPPRGIDCSRPCVRYNPLRSTGGIGSRAGRQDHWRSGFYGPVVYGNLSFQDAGHSSGGQIRSASRGPKVDTKAVTDVPKAPNKRPWMPKKQYLAQLAAEKKAADAVAVASAAASSTASPTRAPPRARSHRRSRSRSHRRTDTRRSPPLETLLFNRRVRSVAVNSPPPFPLRWFLKLHHQLPLRTEKCPTNLERIVAFATLPLSHRCRFVTGLAYLLCGIN